MGVAFVGVFPYEHVQCATWINYRTSSCIFIADWAIVLGEISIAGLALATSQVATTDLPERPHQPGPDFIFPKRSFWKKSVVQRSFQHSWLSEKKNKTSTKADPAFVSSA